MATIRLVNKIDKQAKKTKNKKQAGNLEGVVKPLENENRGCLKDTSQSKIVKPG